MPNKTNNQGTRELVLAFLNGYFKIDRFGCFIFGSYKLKPYKQTLQILKERGSQKTIKTIKWSNLLSFNLEELLNRLSLIIRTF